MRVIDAETEKRINKKYPRWIFIVSMVVTILIVTPMFLEVFGILPEDIMKKIAACYFYIPVAGLVFTGCVIGFEWICDEINQ